MKMWKSEHSIYRHNKKKKCMCHESGCHSPHYYCTSPMDCISHHALHSHIPIHHYTNHTAVTIHSLALIVSPHLHLIHIHTFKQHSYMHSPRSFVLAPADISERFPCFLFPWTAYILWPFAACLFDSACLSICSLSAACPDLCIAPVADSALPTWHLLLPLTPACLT